MITSLDIAKIINRTHSNTLLMIRRIYSEHPECTYFDTQGRVQPYIKLEPEELKNFVKEYEVIGANTGFKRYSKRLLELC
jgi:hypothetical protein